MGFEKFDTKKRSEEGAWVQIFAPDESDTGAKIKVLGRDSQEFKKRIQRVADLQRQKKKGLAVAELERQSTEVYVACTVDWEGVVDTSGKPLECTSDNIRTTYKDYPWVLEQVTEFVEDRANFL